MNEFLTFVGGATGWVGLGYSLYAAFYRTIRSRYITMHKREWPGLNADKGWKGDRGMVAALAVFGWPIFWFVFLTSSVFRKINENLDKEIEK